MGDEGMGDYLGWGMGALGALCLGWTIGAVARRQAPPVPVSLVALIMFWNLAQGIIWEAFWWQPDIWKWDKVALRDANIKVWEVNTLATFLTFWVSMKAFDRVAGPLKPERYPAPPPSAPMSPEMASVVAQAKEELNAQRTSLALARLEGFARGPHRGEAEQSPEFQRLLDAARRADAGLGRPDPPKPDDW
ncbi:MAG: hypothetical protein HQK87_02430 [Nitrospinae bacterium]|nr:hypothetical protein [Nitrospinota bacterium]